MNLSFLYRSGRGDDLFVDPETILASPKSDEDEEMEDEEKQNLETQEPTPAPSTVGLTPAPQLQPEPNTVGLTPAPGPGAVGLTPAPQLQPGLGAVELTPAPQLQPGPGGDAQAGPDPIKKEEPPLWKTRVRFDGGTHIMLKEYICTVPEPVEPVYGKWTPSRTPRTRAQHRAAALY